MARAGVRIRSLEPTDLKAVVALVERAFAAHVASEYSAEGRANFRQAHGLAAFQQRMEPAYLSWVADEPSRSSRPLGLITLRRPSHLFSLWVDPPHHRRGIARALWQALLGQVGQEAPGAAITVNASRYAIAVYQRFGFERSGEVDCRGGVHCYPMRRESARHLDQQGR